MLDNENERMESGWLLEEGQRQMRNSSPGSMSNYQHYSTNGAVSGTGVQVPSSGISSLNNSHQRRLYSNMSSPTRQPNQASSREEESPLVIGQSIWDYILNIHDQSPTFYNFLYAPSDQDNVLRPYSNITNLKIWNYYLSEDLAHGPPYDLEVVEREEHKEEEDALIDGPVSPSNRKVVNSCYDSVERVMPDSCHYLIRVTGFFIYEKKNPSMSLLS
jgi:hypothetical protein